MELICYNIEEKLVGGNVMEIKNKYIIIAGAIVASLHLMISLFDYLPTLMDFTGLPYIPMTALFFTFWGVMHLIFPKRQPSYPKSFGGLFQKIPQ